jgi:sugar lactone lactonase YvrE
MAPWGMSQIETLVDGLDHPEGVAYDRESGLLWAGGEEGQLYRIDVGAREFTEVTRAPGLVLGVAVDGRGRVVLCCPGDRSLSVWDGHELRPVVASGLVFPNYAAFAPDGALYFSDSGSWTANDGRLLRLDQDGSVELVSNAVCHFTNGCAVSPDGCHLWVVESYVPNVTRFDLETGESELVLRLDGTVLDGLAFTEDGLLVTCYRPDRIYHLDHDGSHEIVAEDPQGTLLAAPTNVCFVGPKLDRVVAANHNRRHLSLLDVGRAGLPLHTPTPWAVDAL